MFLARIEGTLTATSKHPTLAGACFLVARRVEADGSLVGEPVVVVDTMGASKGSTVLVTTDGDVIRKAHGNTCPARNAVLGIVDEQESRP